jgi:tRNA pseudouridine55 synthase
LKKDGKRLYELGRAGKTAEDIVIESRQVQIHRLDLLLDKSTNINDDEVDGNSETKPFSHFGIDVECGGGTYIRSLVRDIGLALDTVATMTSLVRTKQGVFLPEHCLEETQWSSSVESIWEAIQSSRDILATVDNDQVVDDAK